jgi:hypothetical protein
MARKEKFGRFVLLEEVETCGLGSEYRAAKLAPGGLEKIVSFLRLKPSLASHPEAVKALMDQVKLPPSSTMRTWSRSTVSAR